MFYGSEGCLLAKIFFLFLPATQPSYTFELFTLHNGQYRFSSFSMEETVKTRWFLCWKTQDASIQRPLFSVCDLKMCIRLFVFWIFLRLQNIPKMVNAELSTISCHGMFLASNVARSLFCWHNSMTQYFQSFYYFYSFLTAASFRFLTETKKFLQ